MAKTKHDFVQLTKSYCKQNKTFLGNTTVTDYIGSDLRLDTDRRVVEGGGGGWKISRRGGGLIESARGFLLDQRNQRANSEAEREQAARRPIAGRDESKPSHRPIYECKWGRAPYHSLQGAGRGSHLSKWRTPLDAAPEAGAGGVPAGCRRGPGRESAEGLPTRQLSSVSLRFEPGAGRAPLSQSEAGVVVSGAGLACSQPIGGGGGPERRGSTERRTDG